MKSEVVSVPPPGHGTLVPGFSHQCGNVVFLIAGTEFALKTKMYFSLKEEMDSIFLQKTKLDFLPNSTNADILILSSP